VTSRILASHTGGAPSGSVPQGSGVPLRQLEDLARRADGPLTEDIMEITQATLSIPSSR